MAVEARIDAKDNWFVGERKILRYTVYADDELKNPAPIAGWDIRWRLFRRRTDDLPIIVKTALDDGLVIADPDFGKVHVMISAVDTIELPARTYFADLWRIDAGEEQVLSYGAVVIRDIRGS